MRRAAEPAAAGTRRPARQGDRSEPQLLLSYARTPCLTGRQTPAPIGRRTKPAPRWQGRLAWGGTRTPEGARPWPCTHRPTRRLPSSVGQRQQRSKALRSSRLPGPVCKNPFSARHTHQVVLGTHVKHSFLRKVTVCLLSTTQQSLVPLQVSARQMAGPSDAEAEASGAGQPWARTVPPDASAESTDPSLKLIPGLQGAV